MLEMDVGGRLNPAAMHAYHITPFPGARIDPAALAVTGIDPHHPFRFAVAEREAVEDLFSAVRSAVKAHGCSRAILVGHNPAFDLAFLKAAAGRVGAKRNPFHSFSTFDTATLAALAYGQTVLARAVQAAGLPWDNQDAHSARYDAQRTAELFCSVVNRWQTLTELSSPPDD